MSTSEGDALLRKAQARVGFKIHLLVYVLVNILLWFIYFMTWTEYAWPLWSTLGWGVGVLLHGFFTYSGSGLFSVDKEYAKLKNKSR